MTAYRRGADFERTVQDDLEKRGYLAFRVAGSKGVADVIAFPPFPGPPWLVQAKTNGRMSPAERKALSRAGHSYRAVPVKASRPKRGTVLYERYHGFASAGYQWSEISPGEKSSTKE